MNPVMSLNHFVYVTSLDVFCPMYNEVFKHRDVSVSGTGMVLGMGV